jgi:hypothetical protein
VIRSKNAIDLLRTQLFYRDGSPKFNDPLDNRVVFFPITVDVAANMQLLGETAEACNILLEHTHWQIRLLSKSNLLHKLIEDGMIPKHQHLDLMFAGRAGSGRTWEPMGKGLAEQLIEGQRLMMYLPRLRPVSPKNSSGMNA